MPWAFWTFTVGLIGNASFHSGNKTDSSLITANRPELEVEMITDDAELKLTLRYVPVGVVAVICVTEISYHIWSGDHTRTFYTPHR
jgi:hypothetical protein